MTHNLADKPANLPEAPFSVRYVKRSATEVLADKDEHLLAAIGFNGDAPDDPRFINVHLESLAEETWTEAWYSDTPVLTGKSDGFSYAANNQILVGHVLIQEDEYPNLAQAAEDAYRRLLEFLDEQGYGHLLRIWNLLPAINEGEGDTERYKQFSIGRAHGLHVREENEGILPAASAIGTFDPGLLIYFIASRTPGEQVENPRQVSAFHYPRQYGPRSPSFSRGKLKRWADAVDLYISGTASVVGHMTQHPGDVQAQLDEALKNIEVLLLEASHRPRGLPFPGLKDIDLLRVYIRRREDFDLIRDRLQTLLGPDVKVNYLLGEICRDDLLVEIEGLYRTRML